VNAATVSKPLTNLGLIGWWPFNEGTSTVAHDISSEEKDMTLINIANPATIISGWTSGKRGRAVALDGSNDYLATSNALSLGTKMASVAFWAYLPNVTAFPTDTAEILVELSSNFNTNDAFVISFNDSSGTGGGSLPIGNIKTSMHSAAGYSIYATNIGYGGGWRHVVVVFDRNQITSAGQTTIYIDGISVSKSLQDASFAAIHTTNFANNNLYVGARSGGGLSATTTVDDLRVYNRVLSASEVMTLYRSGETTKKTVSQNGLIAWWKFNEATSTKATDFSGNGYTATFVGSPSWVTGKFGGAVSTGNTSSDYLQTSGVVDLGSTWTASAWFKYPLSGIGSTWNTLFRSNGDGNDHQVIIRKSDMHLGMYDNTTATAFRTTGFVMSTLSAGWHHLTVTGTGGVQNFYVDGVYVGQTDKQSTGNIYAVGNYQGGSQNWGLFDDIRVYNRVLSTSEIATLYNESAITVNHTQTGRITDGLVGMWSFNGGDMNWIGASAGVAYDRSGRGNSGTLTNMTQSASPASGRVGQALSFNGSNSYVQIPYSATLAPTTAISFGGWMKTTDKTVSQKIFSKTEVGGYAMVINEGTGGCNATSIGAFVGVDVAGVNTYYGACYDRANITNNKWHYVMATYDSETVRLYFDGVEVNSNTAPTGPIKYTYNNPFCIGSEASHVGCGVTQFLSGSTDEVRVYNRALSASEVKQLYLMGK
jgi:hypothetical protein